MDVDSAASAVESWTFSEDEAETAEAVMAENLSQKMLKPHSSIDLRNPVGSAMADVKLCISLTKSNGLMAGVAVASDLWSVLSDWEHICISNRLNSFVNRMEDPGFLTATRVLRKKRQKMNCILIADFRGANFRFDGGQQNRNRQPTRV